MSRVTAKVRPWLVIGWLTLVSTILTWHSISDYLTSRTVAHNKDVTRATCVATNQLTTAIRTVLTDGIKAAQRGEQLLPQFRDEYQQQIAQSQGYLDRLFVIEHC